MDMTIRVQTERGSTYELQHKDGKLNIQKGSSFSGEVLQIIRKLYIGSTLHVVYLHPQHGKTYILDGPITNLVIAPESSQ